MNGVMNLTIGVEYSVTWVNGIAIVSVLKTDGTPLNQKNSWTSTGVPGLPGGSLVAGWAGLRPAVDRCRLQRAARDVPLGEDGAVGAVGDDRLERGPDGIAELRVRGRDGDAVLADLDPRRPHGLE